MFGETNRPPKSLKLRLLRLLINPRTRLLKHDRLTYHRIQRNLPWNIVTLQYLAILQQLQRRLQSFWFLIGCSLTLVAKIICTTKRFDVVLHGCG